MHVLSSHSTIRLHNADMHKSVSVYLYLYPLLFCIQIYFDTALGIHEWKFVCLTVALCDCVHGEV